MPQPIRQWMPEMASYRPHRPKTTPLEERALKQAVLRWHAEVGGLAEELSGIRVRSVAPNRTGRRITVRARIGGRAASFSVCPFQGRANDRRTFDSLWQEAALSQLNRLEVTCPAKAGDVPKVKVARAVAEEARRLYLASHGQEKYFGDSHSGPVLCDFMRALVPGRGTPFAAFHERVLAFVRDGGLDSNYDTHQSKRALEQFRDMAVHALRHGARLDEMQTILDEAVVLVTLES